MDVIFYFSLEVISRYSLILIGFLIALKFIIKNTRTYKIIIGFVLMLVAIPTGIMIEIGVNGCCGAPSTGYEGIGFVLMAVLFFAGLVLAVMSTHSRVK